MFRIQLNLPFFKSGCIPDRIHYNIIFHFGQCCTFDRIYYLVFLFAFLCRGVLFLLCCFSSFYCSYYSFLQVLWEHTDFALHETWVISVKISGSRTMTACTERASTHVRGMVVTLPGPSQLHPSYFYRQCLLPFIYC